MTPLPVACLGCDRIEEGTRPVVDTNTGEGLPVLWQLVDADDFLTGTKRWLCPACFTAEMTRRGKAC